MAFAFDTLGYSKTLRAAGISTEHAEAHAEAAREFIMHELVTKEDLRLSMETQRMALELQVAQAVNQLTIRAAGFAGASVAALAALIKLT